MAMSDYENQRYLASIANDKARQRAKEEELINQHKDYVQKSMSSISKEFPYKDLLTNPELRQSWNVTVGLPPDDESPIDYRKYLIGNKLIATHKTNVDMGFIDENNNGIDDRQEGLGGGGMTEPRTQSVGGHMTSDKGFDKYMVNGKWEDAKNMNLDERQYANKSIGQSPINVIDPYAGTSSNIPKVNEQGQRAPVDLSNDTGSAILTTPEGYAEEDKNMVLPQGNRLEAMDQQLQQQAQQPIETNQVPTYKKPSRKELAQIVVENRKLIDELSSNGAKIGDEIRNLPPLEKRKKLNEIQTTVKPTSSRRGKDEIQWTEDNWQKFAKRVNFLNMPARSAVGQSGVANVRASRALEVLNDPNVASDPYVYNLVNTDIQGIMKGAAPTEEQLKDKYTNLQMKLATIWQKVTSNPIEVTQPKIKKQLKSIIEGLIKVDNAVLDKNLGIESVGFEKILKDDPERAERFYRRLMNAQDLFSPTEGNNLVDTNVEPGETPVVDDPLGIL